MECRSHYWHQKSIVNVIHKLVTYQGMGHLRQWERERHRTVPVRFKNKTGHRLLLLTTKTLSHLTQHVHFSFLPAFAMIQVLKDFFFFKETHKLHLLTANWPNLENRAFQSPCMLTKMNRWTAERVYPASKEDLRC